MFLRNIVDNPVNFLDDFGKQIQLCFQEREEEK